MYWLAVYPLGVTQSVQMTDTIEPSQRKYLHYFCCLPGKLLWLLDVALHRCCHILLLLEGQETLTQ